MIFYQLTPDKMPDRIIDSQRRDDAAHAFHRAVQDIHTAVASLHTIEGFSVPFSANPDDWKNALQDATEKWKQAEKAIYSDLTLLDKDKQVKCQEWKKWHMALSMKVTDVIKNLKKFPQAQWSYNEELATITPTVDVEAVAEEQSIVDVPDEAREHARLISTAEDAISLLREWESSKGVQKMRLETLFSLNEEKLAERWATRSIFYPSFGDDPWERQIEVRRKFKEDQFV